MTVNPGAATELQLSQNAVARLAKAYIATHHGPQGDAPTTDAGVTVPVDRSTVGKVMSPELLAAHARLGRRRVRGETLVAVYRSDDPGGFGPALQVVTDHSAMLMDSVTVMLHRLGVAYVSIMNPVLRVRRGPGGELLDVAPATDPGAPADGVDETWIHVRLAPNADATKVAEAAAMLPNVLADARQVAVDSSALNATLVGLANALDADHAGISPVRTGGMSRPCCVGSRAGTSYCSAISGARCAAVRRLSIGPASSGCCGCAQTCCRN